MARIIFIVLLVIAAPSAASAQTFVCPAGTTWTGNGCVSIAGAPEAQTYTEPIWGLFAAGVSLWGAALIAGPVVTAAIGGDDYEIALLAIPLAGPWACLGACYDPEPYMAALVVNGIVQAASLTMVILGLVIQRHVTVAAPAWTVLPWADPSTRAGGVSLRFEG